LKDNPDYNLSYSRFDYQEAGPGKFLIPSCNHFEWSESWIKYACIVNTPTMIKEKLLKRRNGKQNYLRMRIMLWSSIGKAGAKGIPVRENFGIIGS